MVILLGECFLNESTPDLPLTLQHLESLAYLKDETVMLNYVEKDKLITEKNISPIGYFEWDCITATERDSYVLELMKYIKVKDKLNLVEKILPKNQFLMDIEKVSEGTNMFFVVPKGAVHK